MISEGSPTNTQFTEHPFPSILGFIEIFYSLWKYYYDFTEYFNLRRWNSLQSVLKR